MASPRRPNRLLDKSNISSAYPKELVADFSSGELILVDQNGNQVTTDKLTLNQSGSGNGVASIYISGRTISVVKDTFLKQHPTITKSTDTTSSAQASNGGTFTAIDSVTRDANGHVTKVNTKTVHLPNINIPDVSGYVHTGNPTDTPEATPTYLSTGDIENSLNSTNPSKVLSANQGKVLNDKINEKLNTSGGTMEGKLVAQNNTDYEVKQVRNIFLSTNEPSAADGENGDIWFVYEA